MKYTFFSENPIQYLLVRNKPLEEIQEKYLGGQKITYYGHFTEQGTKDEEYLQYVQNSYPEKWDDMFERAN